MLDCLNNIIGLSTSECSCFELDRPLDYNVSTSGFYLSEDFGLSLDLTDAASDCEQGGIWDLMQDARQKAIRHFVGEYPTAVSMYRKLEANGRKFEGEIGLRQSNSFVSTSFDYLGYRINPKCIRQSRFVLKSVALKLLEVTVPTDVDVSVYSSLDLTTPLSTATVTLNNSTAYYEAVFPEAVIIDLDTKEDDVYYYVLYQLPVGLRPPNNEIERGCNCGKNQLDKRFFYRSYAHFTGIEANDPVNVTTGSKTTGKAYGLLLNGYTECDYISPLCDFVSNPDDDNSIFKYDGKTYSLGYIMALAIGHKAAELIADKLIKTRSINRVSLLDRDVMYGVRAQNAKAFKESLQSFVENLPKHYLNSCFSCKGSRLVSRRSII